MFVLLLVFNIFVAVGSWYGLLTPYLAAGAALVIGPQLVTPEELPSVVIGCYMFSHAFAGVNELAGYSVDPTTSLVTNTGTKADHTDKAWLKPALVVLFFLLPIGKPPAYLMGAGGLVFVLILLVTNKRLSKRGLVAVLIQTVTLGISLSLFNQNHTTGVMALIAGVVIPDLLFGNKAAPATTSTKPSALSIFATSCVTWLTPGLSMQPVSACFMGNTTYRPLTLSLMSSAIEGWQLHQFAAGTQAAKTPLGDILVNEFQTISNATASVGLLTALCCACILIFQPPANPTVLKLGKPYLIGSLVTQAVITAGPLWAIVFILIGTVNHLVQKVLAPNNEDIKTLSFLMPVVAG